VRLPLPCPILSATLEIRSTDAVLVFVDTDQGVIREGLCFAINGTRLEVLRDMANRTRALDALAKLYALEIENLARSLAPVNYRVDDRAQDLNRGARMTGTARPDSSARGNALRQLDARARGATSMATRGATG